MCVPTPKVEIRVTISSTCYFFRHIRLMAAALEIFSPDLTNHEIVVSVGGGEPFDVKEMPRWTSRFPIRWRQVDPGRYASEGYSATNDDRVSYKTDADVIVLADSDVLPIADWAKLAQNILQEPAIAGVMAHVHPFGVYVPEGHGSDDPILSPAPVWKKLAQAFGLQELQLQHELSGWDIMFHDPRLRYAPAYFNGGFIIGPRNLMLQMFDLYADAQRAIDQVMHTYFKPQLARTMSIYKGKIPHRTLPLRYNFPNDLRFDAAAPIELQNAVALHFLRTNIIHKHLDFQTPEGLNNLIARRDLTGSNELFRQKLQAIRNQMPGGS